MFQALNKNPKVFETRSENTSGALQMLMKALGGIGEGGADLSKVAGTMTARDRIGELPTDQRSGQQSLDASQGLALTDQFRKQLELQGRDDVAAEKITAKNTFTTERDKTLQGYKQQLEKTKSNTLSQQLKKNQSRALSRQDEQAIAPIDDTIQRYESDIIGNNALDGIGYDKKLQAIEWMKRQKFDILRKTYSDKDARAMSGLEDQSARKVHNKRVAKNVYVDKKK